MGRKMGNSIFTLPEHICGEAESESNLKWQKGTSELLTLSYEIGDELYIRLESRSHLVITVSL